MRPTPEQTVSDDHDGTDGEDDDVYHDGYYHDDDKITSIMMMIMLKVMNTTHSE